MKIYVPDYYGEFRCIAGACRHSCCIGWEIDIDDETLALYRRMDGNIGERLRREIADDGDTAHFKLGPEERCPFLNAQGLCDLILAKGEDVLCQICADHPRFRNFYSDRTEIGLGLCCEAAGRLILGRKEPMRLVMLEDDGAEEECWEEDTSFYAWRDQLIALAQDRTKRVSRRADAVLHACGMEINAPPEKWAAFYQTLEMLDKNWHGRLEALKRCGGRDLPDDAWIETALEQLLVYFLYRHLPGALDDNDYAGRAAFAVLSWKIVRALCCCTYEETGKLSLDDMVEAARMYSSEIEYSDENIGAILDALQ